MGVHVEGRIAQEAPVYLLEYYQLIKSMMHVSRYRRKKKVYWLHLVENTEEYSHVIGKSRDSEEGRSIMVLAAAAAAA